MTSPQPTVERMGDDARLSSTSNTDENPTARQDDQKATPTSGAFTIVKKIASFIIAQWLILGFAMGCVFGYLFPHVAAKGGVIRSEYSIIYGAIALIFLVSGLQLSPTKLREHALNWRLHLLVQGIGFLIIPCILLAIIHISIAAGAIRDDTLDTAILVGMLVTACLPTTIASNVVMTRAAGGDDAAAIIEVVIGNVLGSFIAPGLIYGLFPPGPDFEPWLPADPSSLGTMYEGVLRQLSLTVLLPLAVGQAARWLFEPKVEWALNTLYLGKFSSACLILLVWTTFSGAFQTRALQDTPPPSIIFNVFMNIVLYALFTLICFYAARPPAWLREPLNNVLADSAFAERHLPDAVRRALRITPMPLQQTIAICFCGAAKTTSLGIPLVEAMWRDAEDRTRTLVQVPVLLYTIEQVFVAQGLVYFFRRYLRREERKESDLESEKTSAPIENDSGGGIVATTSKDAETTTGDDCLETSKPGRVE